MKTQSKDFTPWFLWPFKSLWGLLTQMLSLTSRLSVCILGLALQIAGLVLSVIVLTTHIGIPLMVFGLLPMLCVIFKRRIWV